MTMLDERVSSSTRTANAPEPVTVRGTAALSDPFGRVAVAYVDPLTQQSAHTRWLDDALFRIKSAFLLPDNWDNEGAKAVNEHAATTAGNLVTELYRQRVKAPFVSPSPSGGISLEWLGDSVEVIIEVLPSRLDAYVKDRVDETYWEGSVLELRTELTRALSVLTE